MWYLPHAYMTSVLNSSQGLSERLSSGFNLPVVLDRDNVGALQKRKIVHVASREQHLRRFSKVQVCHTTCQRSYCEVVLAQAPRVSES